MSRLLMLSTGMLCMLGTFFVIQAGVVGSNTTPSREPLTIFPAIDIDNEMRGFAAFEAGFTLEDASTTCLFNAFFPVGGSLTFNGGALNLNLDLHLTATASISDAGIIDGNNFALHLPYKNASFTLPGMVFVDTTVVCASDMVLSGTVLFDGTSMLDGGRNTIDCSTYGIWIQAGGSLLIKDATLRGIDAGKLLCMDSAATLSLSNVTVMQDAAYSFTQGDLAIFNEVIMSGGQNFVFQSSGQATITSGATWNFDSGMTFSYAPASSSRDAIVMEDRMSTMWLNASTLVSTTTGLRLTKGTVRIDGTCTIVSDATVEAEAICFGDGVSAANDISVEVFAESGLYLTSGLLAYSNVG